LRSLDSQFSIDDLRTDKAGKTGETAESGESEPEDFQAKLICRHPHVCSFLP